MTLVTQQHRWSDNTWVSSDVGGPGGVVGSTRDAALVLAFGSGKGLLSSALADLRRRHPRAHIVGCSTAGEIDGARVRDDSLVATAIGFDDTRVAVADVAISGAAPGESFAAGVELTRRLLAPGLRHVLVFSDGLVVNGTALAAGLLRDLPPGVSITGGLAGDGERMRRTTVVVGGELHERHVVAVGFYGDRLRVGYGSFGGWDRFGPERTITRAQGNVLHELDGQSALGLYRRYLGEAAAGLPASALLFPLSLRSPESWTRVVRTILGIDEAAGTLTFAGDMPEGHVAQLMRANFDRLIDGAWAAAQAAQGRTAAQSELVLAVSCVGRRMVLGQRTEEELESVREIVGDATMTGFYSYGELSPAGVGGCELHNQTMTLTTFAEVA